MSQLTVRNKVKQNLLAAGLKSAFRSNVYAVGFAITHATLRMSRHHVTAFSMTLERRCGIIVNGTDRLRYVAVNDLERRTNRIVLIIPDGYYDTLGNPDNPDSLYVAIVDSILATQNHFGVPNERYNISDMREFHLPQVGKVLNLHDTELTSYLADPYPKRTDIDVSTW